jgi:16S rRNA (uracil1498-N3)-methyltransferase
MRRFFCAQRITGDQARLEGAEAMHLARVLRLGPGEHVVLFDGYGDEFLARVQRVTRSAVDLDLLERRSVSRELPWAVHAGVALPKGERQRWLVEKAVELGVTRLVLIASQRAVVEPLPQVEQRLRRYVIEASKQCGRNRLMQIESVSDLGAFCQQAPVTDRRWIAHPSPEAAPMAALVTQATTPVPAASQDTWFAVGPEGGWTPQEFEAACQLGWKPVYLGPRILRVETAVCALAVLASLGS